MTSYFRKLKYDEVKNLNIGDDIAICIEGSSSERSVLINATIVRTLFWNSDADEPDWELETTNGFVDYNSVWQKI